MLIYQRHAWAAAASLGYYLDAWIGSDVFNAFYRFFFSRLSPVHICIQPSKCRFVVMTSTTLTSVCLKKRYTSFLTLACTAVITFDLVSVSAWIVYEQWISPIFKMRSRSTKSETDKAKKLLEVNQTYPYGKPSQNDSSSDVSDTSTLADVLPIFTRAQAMLDSGIRSGIRTLSTTIDNVMQNQTHDIEHTMPAPVQQAAHNNAEPHLISLRAMSTAVHAAAQMLLRGPSHNVPQGRAPQNPMPRISRTAASPSSLVFPNQPQHILGHLLGEVHDLEYSHQGLVLAVAR
jgi:hypothetical protein